MSNRLQRGLLASLILTHWPIPRAARAPAARSVARTGCRARVHSVFNGELIRPGILLKRRAGGGARLNPQLSGLRLTDPYSRLVSPIS